MKNLIAITLALPLATTTLACRKSAPPPATAAESAAPATTLPAPVSVSAVALGTAIGPDKRVTAAAESFGAKDTIYASVETVGSGHARLRARWSLVKGGKTGKVDEPTIDVEGAGRAVDGFPI